MRHNYAFHSREWAAVQHNALAYRKIGSGHHRQARFDDRENRGHLRLIYRLRGLTDTHYVHHAGNSQNWQAVRDVEIAKQIARKKRQINHLNTVSPPSAFAVKRKTHSEALAL
jgi:hypothetical protein